MSEWYGTVYNNVTVVMVVEGGVCRYEHVEKVIFYDNIITIVVENQDPVMYMDSDFISFQVIQRKEGA